MFRPQILSYSELTSPSRTQDNAGFTDPDRSSVSHERQLDNTISELMGIRSAIRAGPYRRAGCDREVAQAGEDQLVLACSDRSKAGFSTAARES